jgi:hypothetical protein
MNILNALLAILLFILSLVLVAGLVYLILIFAVKLDPFDIDIQNDDIEKP